MSSEQVDKHMKIIGLTGGIGSGKSTVSEYLASKGIKIVDADKISHEMMENGSSLLEELAIAFGDEIINTDGSLNRRELARLAFATEEGKNLLNRITHKEISKRVDRQIAELKKSNERIIFFDAPLLFEAGMDSKTGETWLVHVDEATRISRVRDRDGLSEEEILARIKAQMSEEEKLARASHVLDNSGSVEELYAQVDSLLAELNHMI